MSTEIKNTLFQFKTQRAPELLSKEDKTIGFVYHPDYVDEKINTTTTSHFKDELTLPKGTTALQFQALANKSKAFVAPNLIVSKLELENLVTSNFLSFATNFSKIKRSSTTVNKAVKDVDIFGAEKLPDTLASELILRLWDNLFYQIVTQSNPVLRDTIMHILISNHYLSNQSKKGINQKISVVIPPSFFGSTGQVSDLLSKKSDPKEIENIDAEAVNNLQKALQIDEAQSIIPLVLKAKENVQYLEKQYQKAKHKTFNIAQKEHAAALALAYKNAPFEDEIVTNTVTGEVKTVREYTDLELPPFDYVAKSEIDINAIGKALGYEIYNYVDIDKLNDCDSFTEIYEFLDKIIANANTSVTNNSTVSNRMAIIAGVPVSVNNTMARTGNSFPFTASMNYTFVIDIDPDFNLYDKKKSVTSKATSKAVEVLEVASGSSNPNFTHWNDLKIAITNLAVADINPTNNSFWLELPDTTTIPFLLPTVVDNFNNTITIKGFDFLNPIEIDNAVTQVLFKGTIIMADGSIEISVPINIEPPYFNSNFPWSDFFVTKTGSGVAAFTPKVKDGGGGDGTGTTTGTSPAPFIPSRFGVQGLGIADYRKVEQSVCCYEPGEVAHIENIMAREYKEKSTERSRMTDTTTTKSSEKETENLTDTTSTTRNEMNSEVAQVLHEDMQIGLSSTLNQQWTGGDISVTGSFAHNTSQDDSTNQAIIYAQDVTQRAMERVVSKIKTEVVTKVVESYKENNKHGFDNTKGNYHVSGVYRWVNKVYNNQIVNYGKRAMVEFMIPEPARFHILASVKNNGAEATVSLEKPIDPRSAEAGTNRIQTYKDISTILNPDNYIEWVSKYEVDITQYLKPISVSKLKHDNQWNENGRWRRVSLVEIEIPKGYKVDSVKGNIILLNGDHWATWYNMCAAVQIGTERFDIGSQSNHFNVNVTISNEICDKLSMLLTAWDIGIFNYDLIAKCSINSSAKEKWQIETFNAIIAAYEEKLKAYNKALEDAKNKAAETFGTNPLYYRQIERNSLKKNIMHYLVDAQYLGANHLLSDGDLIKLRANNNAPFDANTAVARFMEQAFEWDIISYSFLPFYWGNKDRWKQTYNYQFDDALFTNFMQAGLARVILTVRPGFEKAVNWYMATGQVWNGGQVPTLGDDLFLSIDQELKEIKPTPEGLPWKTVLPSDLTVIQSSTIGLLAEGLPCGCPTTVGGEVHLTAEIKSTNTKIGGTAGVGDVEPIEPKP